MKQVNGWENLRVISLRKLEQWFPERQIHLRTNGRVSFVRFSQRTQIVITASIFLIAGWTAFTSVNYILYDKLLAAKESQIASSRLAYKSLLSEVTAYQQKFKAITRDLEENHGLMLGLVEQNASLQQSLKSLQAELRTTEQERVKVADSRKKLISRLASLEGEMRELNNTNFALKDNLKTSELKLQTVMASRNQALFSGKKMRDQLQDLETRLSELQKTEEDAVQKLNNHTHSSIKSMERVIQLAGLNVDSLLKSMRPKQRGQGGPFIELKIDNMPASRLKSQLVNLDTRLERAAELQNILTRLPLTSPMKSFSLNSGYGKRRDPLNKRWAMHYGVDLEGPLKSPVFASASGKVKYAGWKGKYGKVVEIDHGAGLVTRYAHLHKILVKKGQKINFWDKIGLLGSTGRSTGAHLHYEIVYKGKTRDPMKFIRAGRYVLQQQK
ncbi:MAG: peptidoglycan DD-metalloendopeptidase family protein [Rhodospirillales bacterium]